MLPVFLSAQDDEIDVPFENEPLTEDARTYFVLAGGVTYDFLLLNDNHLNSFESWPDLKLSSLLHLIGGQAVVGIPWVKNLRVGVLGYSGRSESEISIIKVGSGFFISDTDDMFAQSSLSTSMFGFSVHYGFVPFEHFAILGGVNAGWSDVTYEVYTAFAEIDERAPFGFGMDRYKKELFFAMPNIQLEYAITSYIVIRADASYNLTIGQDTDWVYNKLDKTTVNPDFDLNGFKVGLGIMVGLVNF